MQILNRPSILSCTHTFYLLVEEGRKDRNSNLFIRQAAHSIRDYLWLASLGEARHAREKTELIVANFPPATQRHEVYEEYGKHFAPNNANIEGLKKLFSLSWSGSSFGGEKWKNIVMHVEKFDSIDGFDSAVKWVDYALHLQHNTGTVFNKMGLVFSDISNATISNLKQFFDHRAVRSVYTFNARISLFSALFESTDDFINKFFHQGHYVDFMFWRWNHVEYGNSLIKIIDRYQYTCPNCGSKAEVLLEADDGIFCHYCSGDHYVCNECGKLISNKTTYYNNYDGCYYCQECVEKMKWYCQVCKGHVPSNKTVYHHGKVTCTHCANEITLKYPVFSGMKLDLSDVSTDKKTAKQPMEETQKEVKKTLSKNKYMWLKAFIASGYIPNTTTYLSTYLTNIQIIDEVLEEEKQEKENIKKAEIEIKEWNKENEIPKKEEPQQEQEQKYEKKGDKEHARED